MTWGEISYWAFKIALFTGGLACLCAAAWLLLWGTGKLFANMHPRDKDAWRKH
jgi:hypothetical protein